MYALSRKSRQTWRAAVADPSDRPLLEVKVAAKRTGLGERAIYRGIADGVIPVQRFGRRVLVFPQWVDEFLTPPEPESSAA
jgi:excisionase family DNA binding protein